MANPPSTPAMRCAWVAVPVPAIDLLQYIVPESFDLPVPGARVLVPLGTRQVTGCVLRAGDLEEAPAATGELKPLIDVIDGSPFLPGPIVDLATWLAEYYACAPGEAIATAMPPYAWIESERAVEITEAGVAAVNQPWDLVHDEGHATQVTEAGHRLLCALAARKPVPLRVLAQKLSREGIEAQSTYAVARALERQGMVTTATVLRGRFAAFKTARAAWITAAGLEFLDRPPGGAGGRQLDALRILAGAPAGLRLSALRDHGIPPDSVRRLATRGLVSLRDERVDRDPFAADVPADSGARPSQAGRELTVEQQAAVAELGGLADRGAFAAALLHGVTGSGKTEIYLRLARRVVDAGRSALVMVPEIALTPALASLFRHEFGGRVAVQHSGLSDGERHDQWHRIRRGEVDVVVGTRSAVFAPLASPGLIVVDEEHDASYKQEESPRYHGRDVAVVRARRAGALVVLGSATPSMETYQNALSGRYAQVVLAHRVLDRPLAAVRIVNMRDEYAREGPDVVFSEALRCAIDQRLSRAEQVLVLLNRRGFATSVLCRQCGKTIECPNCSVSLTVHGRERRRGRCHYCNYSAPVPVTCPACAAPYLEHIGIGTEQLEVEARRLFPAARVARLDRDVAARRGAIVALLARFGAHEIDLLIGTQMIAKGHDFPLVTLVGIISADVGLGLPDFRASERTFQLLTQVVGRAGRGERPGEAIIQTLHPEHYSVRLACTQDYRAFFAEELTFRRAMHYPPEVSLINAIVRGPSFESAMDDAADLVKRLRARAEGRYRVLGPAPAPLGKLRGEHRAQLFVKGKQRTAMRQAVQDAIAGRPELRRRVTIDVDPLTVL